ncbi:MAG: hypothetical protein ACLPX9_02045 [Rhodomicrobium sp.]
MSARQRQKATAIVWETCESNLDLADPLDEFQSALIVAYEHALEQGISSSAALAVILDMASSEMQRT